ncbi:MAG: Excinuclease ABC subunit B, partial [uncultured Actinomycetospora sp.]
GSRRRGRGALLPQPAHRRRRAPGRRRAHLPGHPLRGRAGAHGEGGQGH